MKTHKILKVFLNLFFFCGGPLLAAAPSGGIANLEENIPPDNCRYQSFKFALKLLEERKAKVLVETGTARGGRRKEYLLGDGGSTLIFSEWASKNNAQLYSVDISPEAISEAARNLDTAAVDYVELVCGDSVQFLRDFARPIDFLYLDSFDFEIHNPLPSQLHHLKEIVAAYPRLHAKSIIMIDDCELPFGGKGKFVINYLTQRGWKIAMKEYQVILIR